MANHCFACKQLSGRRSPSRWVATVTMASPTPTPVLCKRMATPSRSVSRRRSGTNRRLCPAVLRVSGSVVWQCCVCLAVLCVCVTSAYTQHGHSAAHAPVPSVHAVSVWRHAAANRPMPLRHTCATVPATRSSSTDTGHGHGHTHTPVHIHTHTCTHTYTHTRARARTLHPVFCVVVSSSLLPFFLRVSSTRYLITYFIRYPLFILKSDTLVGSTRMSLKTWFSLASTVGYGLSKVPAVWIVSGMNRDHRLRLLLGLIAMMLVCTVGFFAVQ